MWYASRIWNGCCCPWWDTTGAIIILLVSCVLDKFWQTGMKLLLVMSTDCHICVNRSVNWHCLSRDEWERLFMKPQYLDPLKSFAICGNLRSSRFRSVCWKVKICCTKFLNCKTLFNHQSVWTSDNLSSYHASCLWFSFIYKFYLLKFLNGAVQLKIGVTNMMSLRTV